MAVDVSNSRRLVYVSGSPAAGKSSLAVPLAAELGKRVDPNGLWHYPMTRPPFRGLNEALGHVSKYEAAHGRPLLSALVVNDNTRKPGDGFVKMAATDLGREVTDSDEFWRGELARVGVFWTSDDQVLRIDTAIGEVLTELSAIKRQLRQINARISAVDKG
jgi:hypothetical protein